MQEASVDEHNVLIADLAVSGIWQPQCDAWFDIRMVDTDVPLYHSCAPQEFDKNQNYVKACQDHYIRLVGKCLAIHLVLA